VDSFIGQQLNRVREAVADLLATSAAPAEDQKGKEAEEAGEEEVVRRRKSSHSLKEVVVSGMSGREGLEERPESSNDDHRVR